MSTEVLIQLLDASTLARIELEYRRWPFVCGHPPFARPLALRAVDDAQLYELVVAIDDLIERAEDDDVKRWVDTLRETGRVPTVDDEAA